MKTKRCIVCYEKARDPELILCISCEKSWYASQKLEYVGDIVWAAQRARRFERKRKMNEI